MYQKPPSVLKSLKLLLFSLFGEKTINRGELKKKKKKKKEVNNRDGGVLEQPRHKCLIEPVPALTGWLFHRLASQILRLLAVDLILT